MGSLSTVLSPRAFGREVKGGLKETILPAVWEYRISFVSGFGRPPRFRDLAGSLSFGGNVNRRFNIGASLRASGVEGAVKLAIVIEAMVVLVAHDSPLMYTMSFCRRNRPRISH